MSTIARMKAGPAPEDELLAVIDLLGKAAALLAREHPDELREPIERLRRRCLASRTQAVNLRDRIRTQHVPYVPLGARIRNLRDDRGWTLEQLSARSGIELRKLASLESRQSVTSTFAPALATAFGVSVAELVGREHRVPEG